MDFFVFIDMMSFDYHSTPSRYLDSSYDVRGLWGTSHMIAFTPAILDLRYLYSAIKARGLNFGAAKRPCLGLYFSIKLRDTPVRNWIWRFLPARHFDTWNKLYSALCSTVHPKQSTALHSQTLFVGIHWEYFYCDLNSILIL